MEHSKDVWRGSWKTTLQSEGRNEFGLSRVLKENMIRSERDSIRNGGGGLLFHLPNETLLLR